jgi:hypothetical protein
MLSSLSKFTLSTSVTKSTTENQNKTHRKSTKSKERRYLEADREGESQAGRNGNRRELESERDGDQIWILRKRESQRGTRTRV